MLNRFINIINSSTVCIVEDSIFISNHIINDLDCLNSLDTQECINSFNKNGNIVTFADLVIGDTINIELSLLHLMAIGYYENLESFIRKNPYSIPAQLLYIRDINSFSDGNNNEIDYYKNVIYLINAIKSNARHCYSEIEIDISWIFREDKVLLLPFIYDNTDIIQITNIDKIKSVSLMLSEMDTDKKFIYINELIDFLSSENENRRFKFLLSHIAEFADRANNAYQYYIRNFSYNKLKTELDNAALDYSKKIQSVINDAQSKLVVIPAAFVLGVSSMDFSENLNTKNIAIICSLYIFALLIELFVRNQESALQFIRKNIDDYKQSYKSMKQDVITESFCLVDEEWKKQNKRVCIIRWLTWGIPIIVTIIFAICLLK